MVKRKKKIVYGIATNYLQYFFNILLGILLSPLVLKYAGQETMGAYAILMQIIAYVGLIDLGFGYSATRFLAQSNALEKNKADFFHTINIFRSVSTAQNIVMAVIFFFISLIAAKLFGFSANIGKDLKYAFWLLALWRVISGPFGIYNGVLYATNNMYVANLIALFTNFLKLVLSIIFTYYNFALIGLILAQIISQFINIFSVFYFSNKIIGYQKFVFNLKINKRIKEIFSYSIYGFLVMIATRLIFSTDNIVVGYLFGPVAVSLYYLTAQPGNLLYQFVLRISDNFFPSINEYFVKNNLVALRQTYFRLVKISIILMIPVSYGIIFFTKSIVSFWVGSQQYLPQPMSLWFGLFVFSVVLNHISGTFIKAHGTYMKHISFVYFVEGGVNLVLSIILAKSLGIHAIMLASLIASFTTLAYGFRIMTKILNFHFRVFNKYIVKFVLCIIVLLGFHFGAPELFIQSNSLYPFIIGGINIIIYFLFILFFVLTSDEKKQLKKMILKLNLKLKFCSTAS